jgi:hypothetical protein
MKNYKRKNGDLDDDVLLRFLIASEDEQQFYLDQMDFDTQLECLEAKEYLDDVYELEN